MVARQNPVQSTVRCTGPIRRAARGNAMCPQNLSDVKVTAHKDYEEERNGNGIVCTC